MLYYTPATKTPWRISHILIVLISFALWQTTVAQTYTPLLRDEATWYINTDFEGCFTKTYTLAEDSVINGNTYKVMRGNNCYSGASDGYPNCIVAFLREDTAARKVFVRKPSEGVGTPDTAEHIFYDFSLAVGDSIFLLTPEFNSGYWYHFPDQIDTIGWCIVDSIYPVTTLQGQRKAFDLNKRTQTGYLTHAMTWIEGIGAIDGPYLYGGGISWLSCYYSGNTKEYGYSSVDTACICNNVGIATLRADNLLKVYPNPSTGQCNITLGTEKQIDDVRIFDISGKEVIHLNIGYPVTSIIFNPAGLQQALYFIRARDTRGKWHEQKWIKE